jgi:putative peptidoglycan lipid II flippase
VTERSDPSPVELKTLAGNSIAVAVWTMISRLTGFARIAIIAAVLGPTYFGSTFLAIALLPNLALELLGGALIASLLVPNLVSTIDRGDRKATEELVGGVLGTALVASAAVAVLAILAAPLILAVLGLGIDDRAVAADQLKVGWILMVMTMPQLALYGLAMIGGAVMNAHGRFALASAAPAAENIGVIATMGVAALVFGTGTNIGSVSLGQLLLLGLGSTGAVALHATVMMWGARRTGVRLMPRQGWRIPSVRALLRRMTASLGQTGLNSLRLFSLLTVVNTVPGGVVAFRLALNFLYLPVQVGARAISLTMLPTLSRLYTADRPQGFQNEYTRGIALIGFLMIPAAVAYLVLAGPLARAASFGEMAGTAGPSLVASCLAGLALAVLAESAFQLSIYASYARNDARTPFVSTAAGALVSLCCVPVVLWLDGRAVLLAVGLAFSVGTGVSALYLHRRLRVLLPPPEHAASKSVLRTLAASGLMAVPVYLTSGSVSSVVEGPFGAILAVVVAAATGVVAFIALQRLWHSPELTFFAGGLRRLRPRGA